LIIKVAKEQGLCLPGNKVMIFTVDEEGGIGESVSFKTMDIEEEE